MFVGWYCGLLGCLLIKLIYCQEGDSSVVDLEGSDEPDFKVELSVDAKPQPSPIIGKDGNSPVTDSTTAPNGDPFACHACANCQSKSDLVTEVCQPGVQMCYTVSQRAANIDRIVRRGCSTSKEQCSASQHDQQFDSITCCPTHKCNQAVHLHSFSIFLFVVTVLIMLVK